ncbi:MAG TPA: HEAT repeat domain-containing protein [Solirubrobacterales bacterium]|nr:HEAT repeat domain-containing protein [Solirubrobacterales bacterium]
MRSVERRARYEATLRGGEVDAVGAICGGVRSAEAQVDLAVSVDAVYPTLSSTQIDAIRSAMEASELFASLSAQLKSRRPNTRARAALLLTRPGIPAVVEQIVPLLGDADPDVRLVACSGLARAATPRAAELLIWALMAHLLPPERIIERLGAPWAVETMISTLKEGSSAVADVLAGVPPVGNEVELDASLARALGLARDPRAETALVTLLGADSTEVRISAARALGRVGGSACVPVLISALESEDWPVRAQAAKSLGALGAAGALEPLEGCLSDRAWWVRANAARALRDLGEPGIEALRRTLEHNDRYAADRAREQLALHAVIEEQVLA